MANQINHIRLVLDFDTWQCFHKEVNEELDILLGMIRSKKLLGHVGNFHSTIAEIKGPTVSE